MKTPSIPFKIKSVYGGFATTDGILHLDEDQIKMEFFTKDVIIGLKSSIRSTTVSLGDIYNIELKKGILGTKLHISLDGSSIELLPEQKFGEVKVSIPKSQNERAEHFVADVVAQIEQLEEE